MRPGVVAKFVVALMFPVVLGPVSRLAAAPLYTVTDLGTLGGGVSGAVAINERGQVVGGAQTSSGVTHAFLFSDGTMIDLGTLGGFGSGALGINNRGEVVGFSILATEPAHTFFSETE